MLSHSQIPCILVINMILDLATTYMVYREKEELSIQHFTDNGNGRNFTNSFKVKTPAIVNVRSRGKGLFSAMGNLDIHNILRPCNTDGQATSSHKQNTYLSHNVQAQST